MNIIKAVIIAICKAMLSRMDHYVISARDLSRLKKLVIYCQQHVEISGAANGGFPKRPKFIMRTIRRLQRIRSVLESMQGKAV